MTRVLLTAFQPYDRWSANASWLALVELTRDMPDRPELTTRLYPVDYQQLREQLAADLCDAYDYIVLTGQAPGRARIEVETVAVNLASQTSGPSDDCRRLVADGPTAYASDVPADVLCHRIRQAGIPAAVSRHGGTYLCNAALYYTLHQIATDALTAGAIFVHLPLDSAQVADHREPIPSLPASLSAQALRILLTSLPERAPGPR